MTHNILCRNLFYNNRRKKGIEKKPFFLFKALLFISNVTFGEAPLRKTPETPSCRVFHKIYFDMEKIYSD